jgi:DNA recombination-dependent growth factor C
MGILSGPMTVRRFRVVGTVPEGFRDTWKESLADNAFRQPPVETGKEEIEGWVNVQNLLDTDFADLNRWLFGEYAVLALRIDKKTLPAKLFQATLQKRCEKWCEESGVQRCPNAVKAKLKEDLEDEWLKRTLPRVAVVEACWNTVQGWLILHNMSDKVVDRFRKRFQRTFDLQLVPWSPLDWLDRDDARADLIAAAPMRTGGAA